MHGDVAIRVRADPRSHNDVRRDNGQLEADAACKQLADVRSTTEKTAVSTSSHGSWSISTIDFPLVRIPTSTARSYSVLTHVSESV